MQNRLLVLIACFLFLAASAFASTKYNLQASSWNQYFLTSAANWGICSSCTSPTYLGSYSKYQSSPSLSGKSTKFNVGGTKGYTDVLWNQTITRWGTYDGKDIVSNVHNFIYDAYFYVKNVNAMEGIEMDINLFLNGKQYTWGHECRGNKAGNEWDVWQASSWNKGKGYWRPTGVGCYPKAYSWNHVKLVGQRTSGNNVKFISITMNGVTHYINKIYAPGPQSSSWHAMTINFQLDGDSSMTDYSVWLDKLNFSYSF